MFAEVWSADNAGCKNVFGYLNRECSYEKDYAGFFLEITVSYIENYILRYCATD